MLKKAFGIWVFVALCSLAIQPAHAGFEFSVKNLTGGTGVGGFSLAPGATQTFEIYLTNTNIADTVKGFQFGLQINDGAGAALEPAITGIALGAPFAGYLPNATPASPSVWSFTATNIGAATAFTGSQLAATVTVNTSAFASSGPYSVTFVGNSSVFDANSNPYAPGPTLSNGSFVVTAVPEPSSMALLGIVGAGAAIARFRKKRAAKIA